MNGAKYERLGRWLVGAIKVAGWKVKLGGVACCISHNHNKAAYIEFLFGMLHHVVTKLQLHSIRGVVWNLHRLAVESVVLILKDVAHGCVIAQKRFVSVGGVTHA